MLDNCKVFDVRPYSVLAVQFHGSSTQASAIGRWVAGGIYAPPVIVTRDIVTVDIVSATGVSQLMRDGDWLVRFAAKDYRVMSDEDFQIMFKERVDEL